MEIAALVITILWIVFGTARMKWHPFLVLLIAAFALALALGTSALDALSLINEGFGNTMSRIGLIILLGAMLGEILEKGGATEIIALHIVKLLKKLPTTYAMSLIGYVVAIPVFCDAAFILLSPLTKSLSKNARVNGKALTVALSTGLFAPHVLIPPTPGPLAAAATLGLNELGMLIITGGVLSLALVLAGGWFATRMNKQLSSMEAIENIEMPVVPGGFWKAILPLLLPLILIAGGTSFKDARGPIQLWITTLSKPEAALAIGVVIALLISGNEMKKHSWVKNALHAGGHTANYCHGRCLRGCAEA